MRLNLSVFNFLLVVLSFAFFFFSNTNITHGAGTCTIIRQDLAAPDCGGGGTVCGPNPHLNIKCDKFESGSKAVRTGANCCKQIPGNYDYCSGSSYDSSPLNTIGDCATGYKYWECCINPTPTPTA